MSRRVKCVRRFYSEKLKKTLIFLTAGEYFATQDGEVLYTVVGSCIATCIYDKGKKVAGMNHFLLPGMVRPDEMLSSDVGRYGMFAMELLIGELIKLGARRNQLQAKLFGGGNVLQFRKGDGDVTGSNIRFAKKFLELEGIPTVKEDLGGDRGRKILFFSDTNRVLLKRFDTKKERLFVRSEETYKSKVFQRRLEKSPVMLFKT
ncbi:MAG: chemotaxis protein CheD [Desulfobacterales bacterium]|nr:MAG: chemotaxis protein CheD [Desulfobacterales bacterium]